MVSTALPQLPMEVPCLLRCRTSAASLQPCKVDHRPLLQLRLRVQLLRTSHHKRQCSRTTPTPSGFRHLRRASCMRVCSAQAAAMFPLEAIMGRLSLRLLPDLILMTCRLRLPGTTSTSPPTRTQATPKLHRRTIHRQLVVHHHASPTCTTTTQRMLLRRLSTATATKASRRRRITPRSQHRTSMRRSSSRRRSTSISTAVLCS